MTTNEENENGWDSLADELGIEPTTSAPAPVKTPPTSPPPSRPARDPRPEIEGEAEDFGAGVVEDRSDAAMYDPGPEEIADDSAPEPLEEDLLGDEPVPSDSGPEATEGGKRRRRRRRRRRKGGQEEPETEETSAEAEPMDEDNVEEGEAPAEVEDDDDEPAPQSAMEQELEEEVVRARPEWHVMTWLELVSKLYRPN